MKYCYLFLIIFMCSIPTMTAQVDRDLFRVGFNAGLPVGDAADIANISIGVDVMYHLGVSKTVDLGVATGFTNAFGKTETVSGGGITIENEFDNIQHIPLAGSFRFYPAHGFKLGGDVGYALGLIAGNEGGLYYRPMLGIEINGTTELNLSYTGIEGDGANFTTAVLAVLFLF